jgi:hypothetical protein
MKIAFFGSSLVTSYWNGGATNYRGSLKAVAGLGDDITFYGPDAFGRQLRRNGRASRNFWNPAAKCISRPLPKRLQNRLQATRRTTPARPPLPPGPAFLPNTYERRARKLHAVLGGMTQKGEVAP